MKPQSLPQPDDYESTASFSLTPDGLASTPVSAEDVVQLLLQKITCLIAERPPDARVDPILPAPPMGSANLRLSVADGMVFIPLDDIRFIKADGPYAEIHFSIDKMVLIAKPLKEMCNRISRPAFERVHHSYLVNLNWVEKLHRDGYLVLKTQEHIPVSRANWQRVVDALIATKGA